MFFQAMHNSLPQIEAVSEEFTYIDRPQIREVGGKKAFYFSASFTVKQGLTKRKTKSRTYAILMDGYFFQLNFTDQYGKRDCSELFDQLIETVEFGE